MFVFQEPSLLSSLQDNGLTDVMLHALLIKDVSLMIKLVCSLEPNPKCRYCSREENISVKKEDTDLIYFNLFE